MKKSAGNQFRISTKARVNIKLSLGQIIRDTVYFEEFQTQAYFKTTIQMSNVIQNMNSDAGDKDVIHINLIRPLVFVQPIAGNFKYRVRKRNLHFWSTKYSRLNV